MPTAPATVAVLICRKRLHRTGTSLRHRGPVMEIRDYFDNTKGLGVLSTADAMGKVNAVLYSRPHVMADGTLAFIMRDRMTHGNVNRVLPPGWQLTVQGLGKCFSQSLDTPAVNPEIIIPLAGGGAYVDHRRSGGKEKFNIIHKPENPGF